MNLEPEDGNEYNKKAVVVIIDGKTGGHIPKFPNCAIKCNVFGKRVNHGAGYGLEINVSFKFIGPAKAIQWTENAVKKIMQNIDQRVKPCKK